VALMSPRFRLLEHSQVNRVSTSPLANPFHLGTVPHQLRSTARSSRLQFAGQAFYCPVCEAQPLRLSHTMRRPVSKRDIALKDRLAYYLLKGVNKAIRDYEMIADGDRIAVAVSAGKDSLTLLHLLRLRQKSAPEKYETVAVHATMLKSDGTPCAEMDARDALKVYFQSEGQAYAFEVVDVGAQPQPNCFRCSFLRRKAIFIAAQRLGCNKVALGHHADDAAQTTLLNLFFHGKTETLSPKRRFFGGQFEIIRPMIYVPEKKIVRLARACALPSISAHCSHTVTSRRTLVKNVIRALEQEYPKVKINLFRAGLRHFRDTQDGALQDGF